MQRDRMPRDNGGIPPSDGPCRMPSPSHDFVRESADCNDQLANKLNQLANVYGPMDVVNKGAE